MIRSSIILSVLLLLSGNATADNELFSTVRTEAVFSKDRSVPVSRPTRITAADSIRDLLNESGFDAKVVDSRNVVLQKKLEPWTFPVVVTITDDEQNVLIRLTLKTVSDKSELTRDLLLGLMSASEKQTPAVFGYSSERSAIEVYTTMRNADISGDRLRDSINQMAIAAKQNADVWSASSETGPQEQTSPGETVSGQTVPVESATALIGRWSAVKSKTEAFAVEFKTDGSFNLVYVSNGTQTKSSGTFTQSTDSLTLNGAGLKLSGQLSITSATQFEFTPNGSAALVFRKAE